MLGYESTLPGFTCPNVVAIASYPPPALSCNHPLFRRTQPNPPSATRAARSLAWCKSLDNPDSKQLDTKALGICREKEQSPEEFQPRKDWGPHHAADTNGILSPSDSHILQTSASEPTSDTPMGQQACACISQQTPQFHGFIALRIRQPAMLRAASLAALCIPPSDNQIACSRGGTNGNSLLGYGAGEPEEPAQVVDVRDCVRVCLNVPEPDPKSPRHHTGHRHANLVYCRG
eukprot:2216029-Rhodomonas_salina.1